MKPRVRETGVYDPLTFVQEIDALERFTTTARPGRDSLKPKSLKKLTEDDMSLRTSIEEEEAIVKAPVIVRKAPKKNALLTRMKMTSYENET
jgi:hypothetical protein